MPLLTPLVDLDVDIFEKIDAGASQFAKFVCLADELGSLFADSNYSWTEAEGLWAERYEERKKAIIGVRLSITIGCD